MARARLSSFVGREHIQVGKREASGHAEIANERAVLPTMHIVHTQTTGIQHSASHG
jgi:hypothetical protein